MPLIPSIYWPIARLGFSGNPWNRRFFRLFFCDIYRKRVWNPIVNLWAKQKGFNRHEYVLQNNVHSFASALVVFMMLYWGYHGEYVVAFWLLLAELMINMPAIVLSRYLYLITVRMSQRTDARDGLHLWRR
jgi:hypothetical protein